MSGWMIFLWIGMIGQRLAELRLADKNARWMRQKGGYESGHEHYRYIVGLHVLFFAGILTEVVWLGAAPPAVWPVLLLLFLMVQGVRVWCIRSLGRYWNTRIWIVPGHAPQVRGPYRYLRHPNYAVVLAEFILFPSLFGAYGTAVVGTFLNWLLLVFVRIPAEEKALSEATPYEIQMGEKKRFFPSFRPR
ncbi:isoprenylcysteine carboxyl methyltransferase family protein [Lihuaxuella thermophila]|uniref:Methyltransferase n=1 Tax=Lihuaxuella thermophila TaxID=1173111 RepID=A0A1H8HHV5_9BACL|nr:isoprenylcysteine carboxylmethyltransferase family protein [Lihuaxuella thermophila]SEN55802.1 methyltransferase [Lihuaxuella thermophila]